jgi:hypothetical protein
MTIGWQIKVGYCLLVVKQKQNKGSVVVKINKQLMHQAVHQNNGGKYGKRGVISHVAQGVNS